MLKKLVVDIVEYFSQQNDNKGAHIGCIVSQTNADSEECREGSSCRARFGVCLKAAKRITLQGRNGIYLIW
jgi:hypothetical protein